MRKITNPHDRYFRAAMSDPRVAYEFFEQYLPKRLLERVNLNTLKIRKESYVDQKLKLSVTDVLYSVEIDGRIGYFYLLAEHQRDPDILMPFRLLKYIVAIIDQHLKETNDTVLPLVHPIIYYNGQTPYCHSTDLFELFGDFNDLARTIFLQPFDLIDLTQIPDKELCQRVWSGVMQLMHKHIAERDILSYIKSLLPLLQQIEKQGGGWYIVTMLTYAIEAGEVSNDQSLVELIKEGLSPEIGEEVMTLAEQLEARGEAKSKREVAIRLLEQGVSISIISQATDLSPEDLHNLKSKNIKIKPDYSFSD